MIAIQRSHPPSLSSIGVLFFTLSFLYDFNAFQIYLCCRFILVKNYEPNSTCGISKKYSYYLEMSRSNPKRRKFFQQYMFFIQQNLCHFQWNEIIFEKYEGKSENVVVLTNTCWIYFRDNTQSYRIASTCFQKRYSSKIIFKYFFEILFFEFFIIF